MGTSDDNLVASRLGSIEGKLELIIQSNQERHGRYLQLEKRVGAVERAHIRIVAWASGAAAGVAAIVSYILKGGSV